MRRLDAHVVEPTMPSQESPDTEAFPSLENSHAPSTSTMPTATLQPINTSNLNGPSMGSPHQATPLSANLRIQTDHLAELARRETFPEPATHESAAQQDINYNAGLPVRQTSIRSAHNSRLHRTDSLSPAPGSAVSSPGVGPLAEMTPLPSPISVLGSPWRLSSEHEPSATHHPQDSPIAEEPDGDAPQVTPFNRTPSRKRKIPLVSRGLGIEGPVYDAKAAAHARQRSLSDYHPDGIQPPKARNIAVSSSGAPQIVQSISPPEEHMHREEYLAVQKGLTVPKPPSPPDSDSTDGDDQRGTLRAQVDANPVFQALSIRSGKMKRWRAMRQLGKGTFSIVMLATSDYVEETHTTDRAPKEEECRGASLVAVKLCEHGPVGGADQMKIEQSIKREIGLMKAIDHPSLVHLKAVNEHERQTLMVENYYAGGDLYELASKHIEIIPPTLLRRIFSELVGAVRYLHSQYIVHRDIKLENILVNLSHAQIRAVSDWRTYPMPVVTLTDLGLGRWIPKPPESPLLTTRCGSEDYAAPEVLMGQEYDGRSTDAWALGVVLYTIMECRLPFDPVPGSRRRTPTSHRIARCDWQWFRWADEEGEFDPVKGAALIGAKEAVEALLAKSRSRWTLDKLAETEWVKGAIDVEGGLRRPYDDQDEE